VEVSVAAVAIGTGVEQSRSLPLVLLIEIAGLPGMVEAQAVEVEPRRVVLPGQHRRRVVPFCRFHENYQVLLHCHACCRLLRWEMEDRRKEQPAKEEEISESIVNNPSLAASERLVGL